MKWLIKSDYKWLAIWIFLSLHAFIVIGFWVYELMSPHMVDSIEQRVLNASLWCRHGLVLPYSSMRQLPAFWNPYGPVYEIICSLLPSFVHPYFVGRFLSLLATLTLLLIVTLWIFFHTRDWSCSWLTMLILLTAKPVFTFGILHRVDMLALGLSVAGFVIVIFSRHWLLIGIGVVLMVLGFHTKLTALAAPMACVIALWHKDRLKALLAGSGCLLLAMGSFWLLQIMTNGNYLRQAVLGNEPSLWLKPLDMITRPLTSSPFWVALVLYSWRTIKTHKRIAFKVELLYLAGGLLVAGVTATNPGSSWNYLLDFYVALAMLTGRLLHSMLERNTVRNIAILLLVAHTLFAVFHTSYFINKDIIKIQQYRKEFLDVKSKLSHILTNSRNIAIIGSGSAMDVALSFGLPNYTDLPSEMSEYATKLAIKALQRGQIDLVIVVKGKTKITIRKHPDKLKGK